MQTQSFVEGMPNFDGLVSQTIHFMSAKKNQPDISDPRLSPCLDSLKNLKQRKLNKNTYSVVSKSGEVKGTCQKLYSLKTARQIRSKNFLKWKMFVLQANSFLKFSKWKIFVLRRSSLNESREYDSSYKLYLKYRYT